MSIKQWKQNIKNQIIFSLLRKIYKLLEVTNPLNRYFSLALKYSRDKNWNPQEVWEELNYL